MKTKKCRIGGICQKFYPTNKRSCLVVVFFIFLFGVCPLASAQNAAQTNPPEADNYKIGVGDILKVVVLKQDILSQDGLRVGNDGTIRMPMLDEPVPAACLTEEQLSSELTNRYKKFILKPQIYVSVKEFNANPISVGGAVVSPGIFQLKRPMRLREILAVVQGPTSNAGQSVQIIRSFEGFQCRQNSGIKTEDQTPTEETSQQEIISLALMDVMNGTKNANLFLQGGDIIRVPEAELKQAFIIGNVKSPVTVNLKEPVSLSRAIAMAGGFSPGAKTDKIKLKRQIPGSLATEEIIVSLKENSKTKQEDIYLQANDIVDVPGPKPSFFKDLIKGIIPTVTRVPMVIP